MNICHGFGPFRVAVFLGGLLSVGLLSGAFLLVAFCPYTAHLSRQWWGQLVLGLPPV